MGDQEGPGISYHWTPPSLIPVLVPWVGIVLLMLLPANRHGSVVSILVPLAFLAVVARLPLLFAGKQMPAQELEYLMQPCMALAMGVAALWLLAPGLVCKHRFLTFLGMLAVLGISSAVVLACSVFPLTSVERTVALTAALAFGVFLISLILSLTGILCRGRYGPARFLFWLAVSSMLLVSLCLAILMGISTFFGQEHVSSAMLLSFLKVTGISTLVLLAILLPFAVLSISVSLYRERLKGLLHLFQEPPPTMLRPAVEPSMASSR